MGQARIDPNEQLHGGDANPRFGARYRSLEILCQAAVPIEPGEGSVRRPIGDAVEQACEIRRVVVAKDVFSARLLRMPAIIEAWLKASENTTMTTSLRARVNTAASWAT